LGAKNFSLAVTLLICILVSHFEIPLFAQAGVAQRISYGEVLSVREIRVEERSTGVGAAVGSTAGSVAGWALARGGGGWLGGLVGGLAGGLAGHAIEKAAKKKKGLELHIKLEGAGEIAVQVPNRKTKYKKGDKVRLTTSPSGQTQVTRLE
jgi:outer membrane lipoprotein SlyB